jgi:AraC-like DNA-binding protein
MVTFGEVTYAPGGTCGPRIQQDYQLVAIYEGEAHISIDDRVNHLPPHHVALMRPGHQEFFQFAAATATHHTWCAVHPALVDAPLADALAGAPFCLPITSRLHSLIELGLSFAPSELPAANDLLSQLGLCALFAYVFEAEQTTVRTLTPAVVIHAQQFIESNLASRIGLEDIARAVHVSPAYLVRCFRQHLRTTPIRYLWDMRTRRGAQLLVQSGLSVGEIAEQCGFQSQFHFSRAIKRRYGLSPRMLRRRAWS